MENCKIAATETTARRSAAVDDEGNRYSYFGRLQVGTEVVEATVMGTAWRGRHPSVAIGPLQAEKSRTRKLSSEKIPRLGRFFSLCKHTQMQKRDSCVAYGLYS